MSMPLGYLHFCHFLLLFLLNCFLPNLPLNTGCFFLFILSLIFPAFFISAVLLFPSTFFLWLGFFGFFCASFFSSIFAASIFPSSFFFAGISLCATSCLCIPSTFLEKVDENPASPSALCFSTFSCFFAPTFGAIFPAFKLCFS